MRSFSALPGAILLARPVADRAAASWPKCMRCMRNVDAYGFESETPTKVEVWARCGGVRIDPQTGLAMPYAPKVHELLKSSVTIRKGPGWTDQRFTDIIRRLAFFAPDGDRQWEQTLTEDGVTVH